MAGAPPPRRGVEGGVFGHLAAPTARTAPPVQHAISTPPCAGLGRFPAQEPMQHILGDPAQRPPPQRQWVPPISPAGDQASGGELHHAVLALVRSQQAMMAQQSRRDPLRDLVGGDGDGDGSGLKLPGAKGAAAMEIYRQDLEAHPEQWSQRIRANTARAMHEVGSAEKPSMIDFMVRFMPWGKTGKGMTYMGFLLAHALDQMGRGEWHRAEATLRLGMAAHEQSLHEGQRWSWLGSSRISRNLRSTFWPPGCRSAASAPSGASQTPRGRARSWPS